MGRRPEAAAVEGSAGEEVLLIEKDDFERFMEVLVGMGLMRFSS